MDRNSPKFSIFEIGEEAKRTANNDALNPVEKYMSWTANVKISCKDHDDGPTQGSKSVSKIKLLWKF